MNFVKKIFSSQPTHEHFACDICEVTPIRGTRYKCTVCDDYDLCEKCFKKQKHEHELKPILKPIENLNFNKSDHLVHTNIKCQRCNQEPLQGIKYSCNSCKKFHLCMKCYQLKDHDSTHTFTGFDYVEQSFPQNWIKSRCLSESKYIMVAKPKVNYNQGVYYNIPLKNIEIKVEINNCISKTQLIQTYFNDSNDFIEAEYIFPISTTACFDSFEVEFNDQVIKGLIKEKEQACQEYKDNLNRGNTVAYSEINSATPDIMKILIGNIPAQTFIKIKYYYLQELDILCNKFYKYCIPSAVTPRYMSSNEQSENMKDQLDVVNVQTINANSNSAYNWSIQVEVKSPSKITYYKSPSHFIEIIEDNLQTQILKFKVLNSRNSQYLKPDENFAFIYSNENISKPQVILGKNSEQNQYCAMVTFVPNFANAQLDDAYQQQFETKDGFKYAVDFEQAQAEFIFVIDRSGSMEGSRIQKAREALQLFLVSLPPNCYFNICSFGSSFQFMFSESAKYEEKILQSAIDQVSNFSASMGGTEIFEALQKIFSNPAKKNYPRQVYLLTDGGISNTKRTLQLIFENNKYSRVHTIGIGNGCSEELIREGAINGKGNHIFIQDNDDVQGKIISLLDNSLTPFLDNFVFEYNNDIIDSIIPAPSNIPFIPKNQQFVMHVFFKKNLQDINTNFNLKCFDSSLQTEVTYPIEINSNINQNLNEVFKIGIFKSIKILERLSDVGLNNIDDDIFFLTKN